MFDFLQIENTTEYFGNSLQAYLTAFLTFLGGIIVVIAFRYIILYYLRKHAAQTKNKFDDLLIKIIRKSIVPLLYFGSLYLAIQGLKLGAVAQKLVHFAGMLVFTIYGIIALTEFIQWTFDSYWIRKGEEGDDARERSFKGILIVIKSVVWIAGILFFLDNLGFEVSTVITGLGIGGIAIALAAQALLGDLFSYFAILFDRPFEVDDFIVLDNNWGTIEKIGIKTTRIRTLQGEELIVSNTDLTNARVQNFKSMEARRNVFEIGVTYQTEVKHLQEIPDIIQEVIEKQELTEFDRSNFARFADSSLVFQTAYYVHSNEYKVFMDIQETINLELKEIFKEKGISFAYPTQTLYLNKEDN